MEDPSVALYWDFENIHASLYNAIHGASAYGRNENRFTVQEPLVKIHGVYDHAASFGNVVINKAYCNWQWFSRYRDSLLTNSVELIQLFPPGSSAKNGADIKMSLDAIEDILRFPHIEYMVIVGGDSDFIPLAQKAKAAGRIVIGIGCQGATNKYWANTCNEFKYYESLIDDCDSAASESVPGEPTPDQMIKQAVAQLAKKSGSPWVVKAAIRPLVKRLHPTFDEKAYGANSFSELLARYDDTFEVRAGQYDHEVSVRKPG
jgi:uncharacterized protein (TIGR00288 family)